MGIEKLLSWTVTMVELEALAEGQVYEASELSLSSCIRVCYILWQDPRALKHEGNDMNPSIV